MEDGTKAEAYIEHEIGEENEPMTLENIVSVVTLLGLGGAVGTYLRILWERQQEAELHEQEFKEIRYKCVVLLMYAALDFERHAPLLREHGRDMSDRLLISWMNWRPSGII